jgi:uncharacterized membrane protein
MTWLQRYRLRHYVKNSIWILPLVGMLAALVAVRVCHWIELAVGWEVEVRADTAQSALDSMASAMFTFIVFVSSALLIAFQLASAQLSPRIIALVFRDPVTKWCLTTFVFTFTFLEGVLVRIESRVHALTAYVAAYCSLACIGLFLYMIDHVGKALRPSGALWSVARLGRKVIETVYPRRMTDAATTTFCSVEILEEQPTCTISSPRDGVILAFDIQGLVALAQRADCVLEMVPQVGDFVAAGDPLFRVFRGGENIPATLLIESVAVGQERTLEQDPAFAFRIIVDIASKGLSPAINDPTTAVLAIDQIHHLLRNVGSRRLDDERVRDASGRLRLAYRTPDWEDFVRLAVTEIRQFGGTSIQVNRRLRAMLENLIQTLPEERCPLLRQELEVLHRSAERLFLEPEDRALADVSDSQGVGGKHGAKRKLNDVPRPKVHDLEKKPGN